jgi:putative inorganic carbon (HCO3(-)) transporter
MELTGKPITPLKRFSDFFVKMMKKKPNTKLIKSEISIKKIFFYKKDFPRTYIYTTGIKLLLKNPLLGSGPDTFDKVFPQQKGFRLLDKAHSEYIQIGVTTGLPSLIIYLLFIYNLLKININALKQRNLYQIATFFGIIAYLIQAIFSISVVSVAPVFWGLMGLNLAIIRNKNRLNE